MRSILLKNALAAAVCLIVMFHGSTIRAGSESAQGVTSGGSAFPAFIRSLPEAEPAPPPALSGKIRRWIMQGSPSGQVLFAESDVDGTVPFHKHGEQWGVVIEGRIEITAGGKTRAYNRGDTYYIPAGTLHQVRAYAGTRLIDFFEDQERWRPRNP